MRPTAAHNAPTSALLDLRQEAPAHAPDLRDLPSMSEADRAIAARTWRGRMVNEHISARVFAGMIPQMMEARLPPSWIAALPTFAADELRHARMCAGVVHALGHTAAAPYPELTPLPQHEDAGALETVLRNVLSACCLSETVAVSIIRAEQAQLTGTPLGAVLDAILADEVRHARFGWHVVSTTLAELTAEQRSRMDTYLAIALRHQIEFEIPHLPVNPQLNPSLQHAGVCDGSLARSLFYETISEVIVPKLNEMGLAGTTAWQTARETARPAA